MGEAVAQKANIWVDSGYRQMRLCALPPSTICPHAGWGEPKHASALYFGRGIGTTRIYAQPEAFRASPHIPRPYYYNCLYRSIELSRYSLALSSSGMCITCAA